jgi:hypothetical protein
MLTFVENLKMNQKLRDNAMMLRGMMSTLWMILGCEDSKGYYEAMEQIVEAYDKMLKDMGVE